MLNDRLLTSLKLLFNKSVIVTTFYWSFQKTILFSYFTQKNFIWKTANYADSYWFQFDSKVTNLTYSTLPKL